MPNSPTWTATSAGTYYFVASYSGDTNNTAAASGCGAEPISVTTTSLIAGSLAIDNGFGNTGRADQGDTIVVTYTTPPALSRFCSGWSSSSYPELSGSGVVVTATENAGGDGMIASVSDSSGCAGGFHFGSIDLGQGGYFNGTVTFGGASLGCVLIINASCSSIQWNGCQYVDHNAGSGQRWRSNAERHQRRRLCARPGIGLYGHDLQPESGTLLTERGAHQVTVRPAPGPMAACRCTRWPDRRRDAG